MRDAAAKARIANWPKEFRSGSSLWIRSRELAEEDAPFLFVPGSRQFSVMPDALFLHFVLDEDKCIEGADVISVEVCGTRQNLFDKRSRYTNDNRLGVYCKEKWLNGLAQVEIADRSLQNIPIRYLSVLFLLSKQEYILFKKEMPAWGHEYFACIDSVEHLGVINEDVFQRMCPEAHFFDDISLKQAVHI